jgi:cytoskeleton protein RodZ
MTEIGSWLIRAREARGLTLEDAERDTRISRRYLQALEAEQFEVIPAPVYARGFLRSYSQYLGLDPQDLLALFPRDDEPAYSSTTQAQARPGYPQPPSAVGPSRPTWRRPTPASAEGPGRSAPPPSRKQSQEPTIGVDIGVPVPARRLERNPATQARSASVAIVAVVTVIAVVLVALLLATLGDGDDTAAPVGLAPPGQLGGTGDDSDQAATPVAGASGLDVTPGVVPDVLGEVVDTARLAIVEAGLQPVERREKSNHAAGVVIDQSPAPGVQLASGQVTIVVSDGP